MWIFYAIGSSFFAGITAILAKCGIKKTDSNVATAIRTVVVLLFSWLMVLITGTWGGIRQIDGRTLLFLILSGLATGASWLCYFHALQKGDINKVVPIDKSSTVLSILLAFIFLHEGISGEKIIFVLLIGIGTMIMITKKDIKTGKLAIIGEIPEELVGDYSGIDYYAAYNPKDNHVYISSRKTHIIFRFDASQVSLENGDFELYAGIFEHTGHNNGDRLQATFDSPKGMAFDSKGMMYIADTNNNVIRIINSEGKVSTFIGNSEGGYKDGSLEEALFYHPYDVTISPDDFIYVADYGNHRIRCIAIQ